MIPFTCSILKLWGASFCGCDIPKDFNCQSLNPDERDIFAGRRPLRNFPRNETETPQENNRNYGRGHRLPSQSQFDRPGPVLISALPGPALDSWRAGPSPRRVHVLAELCAGLAWRGVKICQQITGENKLGEKLVKKCSYFEIFWHFSDLIPTLNK